MKTSIYKLWRKLLPLLFIFILIHFLKDVTQDIIKIPTFLDMLGNVEEDLSRFPLIVQSTFKLLGYISILAEIFLLISIPIILNRKKISTLEKTIILTVLLLTFFFGTTIVLDPRFGVILREVR